ncbi:MAG TPA: phosphatase PAP2 family protein [Bacteroidota bacterium]|nr:phosphatase PAP2 family protein [Bacteroidota bacterium]
MNAAAKLWYGNQAFLLPFCTAIASGFVLLCIFPKADVHLAIDAHHSAGGDIFFRFVTNLGDGWTAAVLAGILLFVRYRHVILMAAANIASGLTVQLLKHGPFAGSPRPLEYFRQTHALHVVQGVLIYSYNSFPSGHAATACTCCCCLALMTGRRGAQFTLSIAGLVIAFSRVYLSEHFLFDMCAGALCGVLLSLGLAAALGYPDTHKEGTWMELSLLRRSDI